MQRMGPTAGALLGLLMERPMTGWELVAEARMRVGDFWTIQRSQAYRELAGLEANDLVEAMPEEGRGRRPYRITDAGRGAYLDWLQGTPGTENVRIPFLLSVAFSDDIPAGRLAELIEDQRRRHTERLRTYEQNRDELSAAEGERGGARMATLALGIAYERAALAWLDDLPGLLDRAE
jgi:DNA-binding PadR family transcriptional regulator